MSGIVRVALGQPDWRATDLVLASRRPPKGDDSFSRDDEFVSGDEQIDPFTLSPAEVGELLGPVGGRTADVLSQSGILWQINLTVQDLGNGDRMIRFTRPALSYKKIFEAINNHPGKKQNGFLKGGHLMMGFEDDVIPPEPVEHIVMIHFGSGEKTRGEQEVLLSDRDENFVHPGDLAIAEAARLAEHGIEGSLFMFEGLPWQVRTGKTETKSRLSVGVLSTDTNGVHGHYDNDIDVYIIVAAGSPKH